LRRLDSVWPLLMLAGITLLPAAEAQAQKLITPGYLFNSDPTCRQIGDRFYLFATQDPFTVQFQRANDYFKGMYAYHAYSTTDFDHWVDHGSILTGRDVSWNAGGALWDGDAGIPANDRFYAYAPFRVNDSKEPNYGRFRIGVFTSSSVDGPYHDVFGAPMKVDGNQPLEGLSPYVVRDDADDAYLLWGSGDTSMHEVWIAKLKSNMTELAEAPRQLRVPQQDDCGNREYFESPMLVRSAGRWIFTYVAYKDAKGPHCDAKGSYVRYTTAAGMFGPFDSEAPRTLIYPAPGGHESTQQGLCTYNGKTYLAYHVPYDDVLPYSEHHRQVAVTALTMLPDRSLRAIHPEQDTGVGAVGLSTLTLDALAPRRESAEFHLRSGATGEKGLSGEYQLKMKPGGFLLFKDMDFAQGAGTFRVEVSSENQTLREASLEVRIGSPTGPRIATVSIGPTGGRTAYQIVSAALTSPSPGVHDIVLVARGSGGDADGHLFNVTWFSFSPNSVSPN
jgi:arabinoxylan arabinofuranohydrolase